MERTAKNTPLRWLHIFFAVFFCLLTALFGNISLQTRAFRQTYADESQAAEPLMDAYISKMVMPINGYLRTSNHSGDGTNDEFLLPDYLQKQNTSFRFIVSGISYAVEDESNLVILDAFENTYDADAENSVWAEKRVYFPLDYTQNENGMPVPQLGSVETDLQVLQKQGTPARIQLDCFVVEDPEIRDSFSRLKQFYPFVAPLSYTFGWLFLVSLGLCLFFVIRCLIFSAKLAQNTQMRSVLFSVPPDLFLVATLPLAIFLESNLLNGMDTLVQPQNLAVGAFSGLLMFPIYLMGLFAQLFLFFLLLVYSIGSGHLRYCLTALRFEKARLTKACFFGYVLIQFLKCAGLLLLLKNDLHLGVSLQSVSMPVFLWLQEKMAHNENLQAYSRGVILLVVVLLEKVVTLPMLYRCIRDVRVQMNRTTKFVNGDLSYSDGKIAYKTFADHAEDVHSITDRISVSAGEYIQSNKFKAELITNLSHDIKTPLTAITMYAELLKNPNLSREQRMQYLEVLKRHSARMSKLVEDLTSVSDLQSGNIKVNFAEVDFCNIVRQAVQGFEERLQKKGLQVQWKYPQSPVLVSADQRLLWRVIDNMMNNICKYAKEDSTVEISVEVYPTEAVAVFRNVSAFELHMSGEELMTRFVRGDTSRHTDGSGLGLSIAQSLMEIQNGCLILETEPNLFTARVIFPHKD